MSSSVIQRAFAAGELAPSFHARADLAAYVMGLRTCRNFFVRKEGGVSNRAGFKYCASAGDMTGLVKLYKWTFTAADRSTLIEAGDLYFRFFREGIPVTVTTASLSAYSAVTNYVQGDLVKDGGIGYYALRATLADTPATSSADWYPLPASGASSIYEIPTPYASGAFDSPGPLRFNQEGITLRITHTAYQPRELINQDPLGATPRWVLIPLVTGPTMQPPANPVAEALELGTRTIRYVVTAVDIESREESIAGAIAVATISGGGGTLVNDGTPDVPIVVQWDAVANAAHYRVYADKFGNNTFGACGVATDQLLFNDIGYAPLEELTPPLERLLFNTTLNYPEVSAFYQQRLCLAYTDNKPATVWCSRTGLPKNFSIRSPLQDDDAVTFTHASNDMNVVRHLIGMKRLVMLTESGEWVVRGDAQGVLTPFAQNPDQEGFSGASRAFPAIVGNTVLYVQARGTSVRDLVFTEDAALIKTRDLSVFATHLFVKHDIGRLEFQLAPHSITWATRDDGVLLGLTYLPESDTWGWHRHDTGAEGFFEDICVVPEGDEDILYAVVRRTIDGATVRYIERMQSREIADDNFDAEAFFVDAGITYDGAPITAVTGLDHLEGEDVAVLADGLVPTGTHTVTGGQITLAVAASVIHAGLPIQYAEIETLDLDVGGSSIRDKRKLITSLGVVVDKSTQVFQAGPNAADLITQNVAPWETATDRVSKRVEMSLTSGWSEEGRIMIRHTQPLPLTILALMPRVQVGG